MNILVTGANGQLGQTLQEYTNLIPEARFHFLSSSELNITDQEQIHAVFKQHDFSYCINCAAYTKVDLAEDEEKLAYEVNAEAVRFIAEVCKSYQTTLIHISTDYVFDGEKKAPYTEMDQTNPLNVYGASKLKGEQYINEVLKQHFILRTSWLYSKKYGANFYQFIKSSLENDSAISIVDYQYGSPTKTDDLAKCILHIIQNKSTAYGTYHYTAKGVTNWYNFSKKIAAFLYPEKENLISPTDCFKTKAKRSNYSKLDTHKIEKELNLSIPNWEQTLFD